MRSLLIFLSAAISWTAMAHVPYVEGLDYEKSEAFHVAQPIEKSLAIYGSFDSAEDLDRIRFRLTESDLSASNQYIVTDSEGNYGRKLYLNSLVPACAEYASIQPILAVIGPVQSSLSPQAIADVDVPFDINSDQGIYILTSQAEGSVFHEGFTNTSYWEKDSIELILTKAGEYEILVWEKNAEQADYVISLGDREMFGLQEIAQSMKRISYLRQGKEIQNEVCRDQLGKS